MADFWFSHLPLRILTGSTRLKRKSTTNGRGNWDILLPRCVYMDGFRTSKLSKLGHNLSVYRALSNYQILILSERDCRNEVVWTRRCCPSKSCLHEKEFAILNEVPIYLRSGWRKCLSTRFSRSSSKDELLGDNQCHAWASRSIPECGTDSRPSRDELGALVCTMMETMLCEKPFSNDERPRKYDRVFPVNLTSP